jgi:hypothetical protein
MHKCHTSGNTHTQITMCFVTCTCIHNASTMETMLYVRNMLHKIPQQPLLPNVFHIVCLLRSERVPPSHHITHPPNQMQHLQVSRLLILFGATAPPHLGHLHPPRPQIGELKSACLLHAHPRQCHASHLLPIAQILPPFPYTTHQHRGQAQVSILDLLFAWC